ncbi:MAG: S24 family peptidase [Nitrospirota bacterium]|nr:S24 family peptidase [Nitrospirota bacterium]
MKATGIERDAGKQAFSDRLNQLLDEAGWPPKGRGRQIKLAKVFGVSQKGARKWLEGEGFPEYWRWARFVAEFSTTTDWLFGGTGAPHPAKTPPQPPPQGGTVPLITWATAVMWYTGAVTALAHKAIRPVHVARNLGPDTFALLIEDDSMCALAPAGSIIFADPAMCPPSSGDYVVCVLENDDRAIFRRYVERDDRKYLDPLNPTYPPSQIYDDAEDVFVGVVRAVRPPEIYLK